MNIQLSDTFRAFKSRNYSLFFSGQLVSRIGMWMQRTAVIWVIYSMTHSTFMLGLTTFAEQFPSFIFSPLGGIVSDRYDRYKILMITQIVSALQAVTLAVLYFTNHSQVWQILSLSVVLGIANAFDIPARQPLVNDIIKDPKDLPNAIAMNSSLNNLARLIGPALSGFVVATYGAGNCFAVNAVSFIAVIISLTLMKFKVFTPVAVKKKFTTDLVDGFVYLKKNEDIGITILQLTLICLLVATYNTLLPVYAKEIFKGDARTFGYMNACIGGGALMSTIYLASLASQTNLKKMLFTNTVLLGFALIAFSHLNYFPASLLLAVVCGFATMSVVPICNTIVQVASAPIMRGRMTSYFAMSAFGMLPLGSLLIGSISPSLGVQNSILLQGILALVIAAAFAKHLLKRPVNSEYRVFSR